MRSGSPKRHSADAAVCPLGQPASDHVASKAQFLSAATKDECPRRVTSIARRYSALRQFFLYLQKHKLVQQNPAKIALTMKNAPAPTPRRS